ncbi:MAG: hypothetical protein ACJAR2_004198 [Ilumatobacter sp.]
MSWVLGLTSSRRRWHLGLHFEEAGAVVAVGPAADLEALASSLNGGGVQGEVVGVDVRRLVVARMPALDFEHPDGWSERIEEFPERGFTH